MSRCFRCWSSATCTWPPPRPIPACCAARSLTCRRRTATGCRAGRTGTAVSGGGEDTDFGQLASSHQIALTWVGGAWAYHQHRERADPPVEHSVKKSSATRHSFTGDGMVANRAGWPNSNGAGLPSSSIAPRPGMRSHKRDLSRATYGKQTAGSPLACPPARVQGPQGCDLRADCDSNAGPTASEAFPRHSLTSLGRVLRAIQL